MAAGQVASPEIEAGNDLILSVNITRFNLPLTNITWRHGGDISTGVDDRVMVTTNYSQTDPPVTSTFQLSSLIPLDSGMYVVIATNPVGSENFSFNVAISGKLT